MVLLLYLWENVRRWSSFEHLDCDYDLEKCSHACSSRVCSPKAPDPDPNPEEKKVEDEKEKEMSVTVSIIGEPEEVGLDQGYQQMGGLRRLETGTIRTHFYPEGGWGWIVCACAFLAHVTTSGAQLSAGALHIVLANKFQESTVHHWLGPFSWSVSSVFSPIVVNLCRRKNARVLSLVGGILFPLSLVFTSLATELPQIFISFGLIGGIGSCMVRESSGVVLGEFFRKRRQFVEQVVMAGTGVGVTLFSLLYLSFTRHLEWGFGFRVGAAFATISFLLPAFYRTAAKYQPRDRGQGTPKPRTESPKSPSGSVVIPIGSDICRSLQLFCIPSLKPLLWSSAISSFGLYAPVFLMSDFGRSEGLSGGSLLLLQTHLGLGLSLGVILGAILTLKKFRSCQLSPRVLCTGTACLTGLSMIAISTVKGYYGYSLSAWIYGVALGAHLYTLKVLTMELTRTKHWGRIWSCVQSLMSPGILLGSGLTSYLGKSGFYACATAVLIGAGLLGFQIIDITKCSSPQLSSSADNDSPIPPAPPPISLAKYHGTPLLGAVGPSTVDGGLHPLRRSLSLQQPVYPCCREAGDFGVPTVAGPGLLYGYPPGYSPYCRECVMSTGSPVPPAWGLYYQPTPTGTMMRSHSLPQTGMLSGSQQNLKSTGTQTNPNSPVKVNRGTNGNLSIYPGSYDRLPTLPGTFLPQDRVIRDQDLKPSSKPAISTGREGPSGYKGTVMFASNPQLFPPSSSATSTTDRSSNGATYTLNNHNHNHNHHHHHNHAHNGLQKRGESSDQNNFSRESSPHHYYPQMEERRAQFMRGDAEQSGKSSLTRSWYQPQIGTTKVEVEVETHGKKGMPAPAIASKELAKQPPAFTRHYFDSSKIQKGTFSQAKANIFPSTGNGNIRPGPGLVSAIRGQGQGQIQVQQAQPFHPTPQPNATMTNINANLNLQRGHRLLINAQREPTLPISVTAVNAKLQQYQRERDTSRDSSDFDWRRIQRQSASLSFPSENPFEDDPDPPYYPAAMAKQQKVSGNEFDIEPPKFNSLGRRPLSRSGQTSSVSSQQNYSVTPTPVHQRSHFGGNANRPAYGSGPSTYYDYAELQFDNSPATLRRHHQDVIFDRRRDPLNGDCPYCDPRGAPPLSLSVPALRPSDPHYMCHYGYGGGVGVGSILRRRNTWHHRDQLEVITTTV